MSSICPECQSALKFVALDCPHCGAILPPPASEALRSASPRSGEQRPSPPAEPLRRGPVGDPEPKGVYDGPLPDVYDGFVGPDNPYAAPRSRIGAGPGGPGSGDAPLAGRFSRLAARVVDQVLVMGAIFPAAIGAGFLGETADAGTGGGEMTLLVLVGASLLLLGWLVVTNLRLMSNEGQTVGKRMCKVRVLQVDGSPLPLGRWIGMRTVLPGAFSAVPYVGGVFGLINALAIFGVEKRCVHDHLAGSKVVVA